MERSFLEMHNRKILSLILLASFGWSLLSVEWSKDLIHAGGTSTSWQILKGLVTPNLTPEILQLAVVSTWKTLAYAVAGMSLAIILALVLGILASGILAGKSWIRSVSVACFRGLLGSMRAIHELVWAWLFVSATGLSPLAAIFALAIPYGGTLGRILADILNDVPKEPIKALESSGAGKLKVLFYGYLPIALVDMVSYTMYRFECAIRSATVMSFVGLGGLGYQIQISLADLNYQEVWTFVYFLIGLVIIVDFWSNQLRRRLVA